MQLKEVIGMSTPVNMIKALLYYWNFLKYRKAFKER